MVKNKEPKPYVLPKNAIQKIDLGQSFAEYDKLLEKKGVYVQTPALLAAIDPNTSKCFFVGRRGTGKTAISKYIYQNKPDVVVIKKPNLSLISLQIDSIINKEKIQILNQGLIACFKRTISCEIFKYFLTSDSIGWNRLPNDLKKEKNFIENYDFDDRCMSYIEEIVSAYSQGDFKSLSRSNKRSKEITSCLEHLPRETYMLFDGLDEFWDGSDATVTILMTLMHACIELAADYNMIRPLVFLRENVFDRIRKIDSEFTRLETCVVSLEWTKEFLQEMIERRILLPINTRPPLGQAWNTFFENNENFSSRDFIFSFCQNRPRDVLTFCSAAVESAQNQKHDIIRVQDIQNARLAFSESRLKDLGDEYAENFPQIASILYRFHGLSRKFSYNAIDMFVQLLLKDNDISLANLTWLYEHTQAYKFIELLYSIGFVGIQSENAVEYRGIGIKGASPPSISEKTYVEIHPSYADALHLQDKTLNELPSDFVLQVDGTLFDIPEEFTQQGYIDKLDDIKNRLSNLKHGRDTCEEYENIIGEILKYCFWKQFNNIEHRARDCNGAIIRDWMVANIASDGFWERVLMKFGATQIIWECKNYAPLRAEDFAQIGYYLNSNCRFAVICFRGKEDVLDHNAKEHLRKIKTEKNGLVLLFNDRDMEVIIRQAKNGKKNSDAHINERFDSIERL